ncbi:MAG: GNAT family N-acetyltransferase [Armatimonadota bacterium]
MKTVIVPLDDAAPSDQAALPDEWAEWAEEPGQIVRIEEDGSLLGMLHAVIVGRGEAWFEGLWVRPSARGRGVGRRLVAEAEALIRGYGATTVRTAVPARDYGALAVAERTGFVRYSEAAVLVAEIRPGPLDSPYEAPVVPATTGDARAIMKAIERSPHLVGWRSLIPLGWRFRRSVPELLGGLIKDGRVLRAGEGAEGIACFGTRGDWAIISILTGPAAHRLALFGAVAERARESGAQRIALFAADPRASDGLRASFVPHPWCPDDLVIVEKTLTTR